MPNLMIGFGIDETQAEYVAEIKLRHLNRGVHPQAHHRNRGPGKGDRPPAGGAGEQEQNAPHHCGRAERRGQKYGQPRRSEIITTTPRERGRGRAGHGQLSGDAVLHPRGAISKDHPQSLRMSGEQKLKEGDEITQRIGQRTTTGCCSLPTSSRYTSAVPEILRTPRPA